jgi:hypothetical protein
MAAMLCRASDAASEMAMMELMAHLLFFISEP